MCLVSRGPSLLHGVQGVSVATRSHSLSLLPRRSRCLVALYFPLSHGDAESLLLGSSFMLNQCSRFELTPISRTKSLDLISLLDFRFCYLSLQLFHSLLLPELSSLNSFFFACLFFRDFCFLCFFGGGLRQALTTWLWLALNSQRYGFCFTHAGISKLKKNYC